MILQIALGIVLGVILLVVGVLIGAWLLDRVMIKMFMGG